MGRHSNIILCRDNIIIDAIKRIDEDKSRVRQILPKENYEYPPQQEKLDPFMMDKNAFQQIILNNANMSLAKIFNNNILGLSLVTAKYLGFNSVDMDSKPSDLTGSQISTAAENIYEFYQNLKEMHVSFYLIKDINTGIPFLSRIVRI